MILAKYEITCMASDITFFFFLVIGYIIGGLIDNFILAVNWLHGLQGQGQTVPLNT